MRCVVVLVSLCLCSASCREENGPLECIESPIPSSHSLPQKCFGDSFLS